MKSEDKRYLCALYDVGKQMFADLPKEYRDLMLVNFVEVGFEFARIKSEVLWALGLRGAAKKHAESALLDLIKQLAQFRELP